MRVGLGKWAWDKQEVITHNPVCTWVILEVPNGYPRGTVEPIVAHVCVT